MSIAIGVTSGTADKVEVITTGATVALDVTVTQIDKDNGAPPVVTTVRTNTGIASATTTKITTDAATNHEAMLKRISAVNVNASAPIGVQFVHTLGAGTARKLTGTVTLAAGEALVCNSQGTWFRYDSNLGVYSALLTPLTVSVLNSGSAATYTPPTGCRAIRIRAVGGGGAGGGGATTASQAALGAGGGSGGYSEKLISPPASSYTYTIGAGGTAGTAGNNAGNNGADTTIGTITAKGGTGGGGMAAGTTAASVSQGGAGGVAGSGGDQNQPGEPGGPGFRTSGTVGQSGTGASSVLGGGAPGVAAQATGTSAVANTGGGGGGGCTLNGGSATAGGAGGSGIIVVEEFY